MGKRCAQVREFVVLVVLASYLNTYTEGRNKKSKDNNGNTHNFTISVSFELDLFDFFLEGIICTYIDSRTIHN